MGAMCEMFVVGPRKLCDQDFTDVPSLGLLVHKNNMGFYAPIHGAKCPFNGASRLLILMFSNSLFGLIKEQLVIQTIINSSACISKKGIRYQANWLFECMILRIKSPKAYDHLREVLLPLPHPDTLRRLIRGIPGAFGMNQFAIDSTGKNLHNMLRCFRRGSLVRDEMSVKKAVKFIRHKMNFDGFPDYEDDVYVPLGQCKKLADHALVLMFRPYRAKWVQPIGVYATSGPACSMTLQMLGEIAISALQTVSAIVSNVTCNGH
ncbi:hypothetical protein OUZ56_012649 [Daphnia magna]|uniref:Uncharacterized protein n=1 Tax=Daphnia magna TaxID=35525 RepID=A0ABQ9Z3R7_9CRUS|nr:hypothetical protein OUZ56_012649 [Daphnia magna]